MHTAVPGIGYVYQDDQLLQVLTVKETLLFSARMRLPRHLSEAAVLARVDAVVQALDLKHIQGGGSMPPISC